MKNDKGYLLLETAAICCAAILLIMAVAAGYSGAVRQMTAAREMRRALEICELHLAGSAYELPPNWQVIEEVTGDNPQVHQVQVVQGGKIICNLAQVAK